MSARKRVALLFGGRSGEHEVSLRSAESVAGGLERDHDVVCILIEKTGRWRLLDGPRPGAKGGEAIFLAPDPTDGGTLRRFDDALHTAKAAVDHHDVAVLDFQRLHRPGVHQHRQNSSGPTIVRISIWRCAC